MKRNIIISATLFVVCVLSALILAALNSALTPRINKNEKQKIEKTLTSIFPGYTSYEVVEIKGVKKSDSSVKAEAELTTCYTLHFASGDKTVYLVEGKNGFGDAKVMFGVDETNTVVKIEYVSFTQTNEATKIKSLLINEYEGKVVDSDNIVLDSYIKDVYSGGTKGSKMMNLMMVVLTEYIEGGTK